MEPLKLLIAVDAILGFVLYIVHFRSRIKREGSFFENIGIFLWCVFCGPAFFLIIKIINKVGGTNIDYVWRGPQ